MKLQYENTLDDLLELNQHYVKTNKDARRRTLWQRWGAALYFAVAFGWLFSNIGVWGWLMGPLLGAMWALVLPTIWRSKIKRLVQRQYRKGEYKSVIGPRELEATTDGIISRTPYTESKFAWAMIDHIDSTPNMTYIYTSPSQSLFIPHDRITGGDFRAFMAEIGKHYHPDKKLESQTLEGQKLGI